MGVLASMGLMGGLRIGSSCMYGADGRAKDREFLQVWG